MKLVIALLVSAFLGGCGYTYVTNRVTVIDAESGRPIPNTRVGVNYGSWPHGPVFAPGPAWGTTNEAGVVDFRVTADRKRSIFPLWSIDPEGYLGFYDCGEFNPTIEVIDRKIAAGQIEEIVPLTLRRWREPGPTVLITIPVGYRGFVRVCPPVGKPAKPEPHQRLFECTIDAQGRCQLPPATILSDAQVPVAYTFKFDDGTPLPEGPRAPEQNGDLLAAWGLWHVERCDVFVIAEEPIAWKERKALWPNGVVDSATYPRFEARVRAGRFPEQN